MHHLAVDFLPEKVIVGNEPIETKQAVSSNA
jgi:hypothetical protein